MCHSGWGNLRPLCQDTLGVTPRSQKYVILNKIIRVKPQTEHYTAYKNSLIENKTIKLQQPTYKKL